MPFCLISFTKNQQIIIHTVLLFYHNNYSKILFLQTVRICWWCCYMIFKAVDFHSQLHLNSSGNLPWVYFSWWANISVNNLFEKKIHFILLHCQLHSSLSFSGIYPKVFRQFQCSLFESIIQKSLQIVTSKILVSTARLFVRQFRFTIFELRKQFTIYSASNWNIFIGFISHLFTSSVIPKLKTNNLYCFTWSFCCYFFRFSLSTWKITLKIEQSKSIFDCLFSLQCSKNRSLLTSLNM